LGSFPTLNLHDPEIYIADLCVVLTGYPGWAGRAALEQAKDRIRYPACRAELRPLLEDQVAFWHRQARLRRERRAAAVPRLTGPPRPTREELKALYGENWGLHPDPPRPPLPTREQARALLVAQIGEAAFAALPDAENGGRPPRAARNGGPADGEK
jgi:hypothetical protein